MLGENAIAVRTKAMKCLSEVVAVDPSILARVKKRKLSVIMHAYMHCSSVLINLFLALSYFAFVFCLLLVAGYAAWCSWTVDG